MRELATPVPAGRHRSRRRAPKFLVGVLRVAFVLTAIVWIVAMLRVSSELATPADGFASALVDTAALWALYLVLAWFGKHPPASLLHWFRSLGKSRQRRDRSEMAQIIDLVSWVAAVAAVLLVMAFPDARSNGKELAIALLFAVTVAVGAVRLVGWILRGFFRM